MAITVAVLIVIALVPLGAVSQALPATPAQETETERREISRSINDLARAYVERLPETFEKLVTPDYISVRGKPVYNAREHLLALIKAEAVGKRSGKPRDYQTLSFDSEDVKIRIFGNAAIVSSLKKNEWQYRGSKCLTQYRATDLWIKNLRGWQLAAGAATTIQCDPVPWYPAHPAVAAVPEKTEAPAVAESARVNEMQAMMNRIEEAVTGDGEGTTDFSRFFTKDFESVGADSLTSNNPGDLLNVFRLAADKAQRSTIVDEAYVFYEDAALHIFGLRTRGKLGTTERTRTTQYFAVLVRSENDWKYAAVHAMNAGPSAPDH